MEGILLILDFIVHLTRYIDMVQHFVTVDLFAFTSKFIVNTLVFNKNLKYSFGL